MRLYLEGTGADVLGLRSQMETTRRALARAVRATAKDIAEALKSAGDTQLASAGLALASDQWRVTIKQNGEYVATVNGNLRGFWKVFEKGSTIQGKPLLWIPIGGGGERVKDAGPLFRVDRAGGKPLLGSVATREIEFVGVATVQIKQRLDFNALARAVAGYVDDAFTAHFAQD